MFVSMTKGGGFWYITIFHHFPESWNLVAVVVRGGGGKPWIQ